MADITVYNSEQAQEMIVRMNAHFASGDKLMKVRQTNRSRTQDKLAREIKRELDALGVKITHNAKGFFRINPKKG